MIIVFQELGTQRKNSIGPEHGDLYYLDVYPIPMVCPSVISLFDHHCCLGQPSFQI